MISRGASLVLAVMLAASCAGSGRAAPSATATSTVVASPSATPLINVYDMMGAFPPATFYVLGSDGLKAIALLNHATRYTIPLGKDAQVAAAGTAGRVYVLDQVTEGARIRWFDIDNGTERASRIIAGASVVQTGIGHGALAIDDTTGLVYALLSEATSRVRVDEFDWFTLKPSRTVLHGACGERIASAAGRVAAICMNSSPRGELRVADGTAEFTLQTGIEPIALAMLGDGTLMAGSAKAELVRLARHQTELERVSTLKDYGKALIPDGIAVNAGCCFYYGVLDSTASDVQVRAIAGGPAIVAFPTPPTGGLFVQAPFAYFVLAGRARHVDINQGFGEVMADIGPSALPGAVSNR